MISVSDPTKTVKIGVDYRLVPESFPATVPAVQPTNSLSDNTDLMS